MIPGSQRSGILLVDKPAGITSADVTNQLKRKHKFARIGHGGTLDPFATGLLVVLLGEATKVARFLLEGEKEYEAVAKLGVETATGDHTGEVVANLDIVEKSAPEWQEIANSFLGRSSQTPPAYSAIKVKGKPLYEYARKGEEVEVKAREITIRSFEILEATKELVRFRVRCSGGTYIRVLALDLAKKAGTTAHLMELRRTGSSSFRVEQSLLLEKALQTAAEELPLASLLQALDHLPKVPLNEVEAQKVRHGNIGLLETLQNRIEKPGYFLMTEIKDGEERPVGIGNHHPMLRPSFSIERVFDPNLVRP